MPDYRRFRIPGGCFFYLVNPLERRGNDLLTHCIDPMRNVVRLVRTIMLSASRLLHLLGEPHLDQGRVGHVALVGGYLDALQESQGLPERDRLRQDVLT